MNFALIGAAGYIAPRHMRAIVDTGNSLATALDVNDSVGIIDSYNPECRFFTSQQDFEAYVRSLAQTKDKIDYFSICSPNYRHIEHVKLAFDNGANAICEKPLVITSETLDELSRLEEQSGCRVYTILQLRLHPALLKFRQEFDASRRDSKIEIDLAYITRRGNWYHVSWKGNDELSGGLAMNIGIHFFDSLIWLFGGVQHSELHLSEPDKMAGFIELENARVRWYLSVDKQDLLRLVPDGSKTAYRSFTFDGKEMEFTDGFTDLHTESYRGILTGKGMGIEDARPSLTLVDSIRSMKITRNTDAQHPLLADGVVGQS
jgi:UDP-N-acetyl-2-amino-2-deoxyglucuronate dehydrogenase